MKMNISQLADQVRTLLAGVALGAVDAHTALAAVRRGIASTFDLKQATEAWQVSGCSEEVLAILYPEERDFFLHPSGEAMSGEGEVIPQEDSMSIAVITLMNGVEHFDTDSSRASAAKVLNQLCQSPFPRSSTPFLDNWRNSD